MKKPRTQTYEVQISKAPWKHEIKADSVSAHDGMLFFSKNEVVVNAFAIALVEQVASKPHHFAVIEEAA